MNYELKQAFHCLRGTARHNLTRPVTVSNYLKSGTVRSDLTQRVEFHVTLAFFPNRSILKRQKRSLRVFRSKTDKTIV